MIDILLSEETRISYEYSEKILWERVYPETPFSERDYTGNVLLYTRSYTSVPLGMGNTLAFPSFSPLRFPTETSEKLPSIVF